jgi:hypothetical protein
MRAKLAALAAMTTVVFAMAPAAQAAPRAKLIHVHVFKAGGRVATTANCSNDAPASGGYATTGWKVAAPVTAHLNSASVPGYLGDVTAALQSSFDAWGSAVPRITVVGDGTRTKPTATRTHDLMFGRTSGSSLAITYTWRWSDGLVESDMIFNSRVAWFQAPSEGDGCHESVAKYDVQNIATHEAGHVYGLDHPAGDRFETMYAYGYSGETLKRSPANGDLAGVAALY